MNDTVSVPALIALAAPYLIDLLPVVIGWAAYELRAHRIVNFSQASVDKLDTLAKAEAGSLIAADEKNLAGVSIKVGSPIIADAVDRIVASAPTLLKDAGVTPDSVATMITGHLGNMQASAPAPSSKTN